VSNESQDEPVTSNPPSKCETRGLCERYCFSIHPRPSFSVIALTGAFAFQGLPRRASTLRESNGLGARYHMQPINGTLSRNRVEIARNVAVVFDPRPWVGSLSYIGQRAIAIAGNPYTLTLDSGESAEIAVGPVTRATIDGTTETTAAFHQATPPGRCTSSDRSCRHPS
jgi:hypothetical protein